MIDLANERLINSSVKNLSFKCSEASSFKSSDEFDLVFISGLLIYLDDDSIKQLLTNIDSYTNGKSVLLLLRDGTGIKSTHVLDNVYSEALKSKYSAIYRTSEQYKSLFSSIGFEIISETDMFDEGSPLNKWKETRLRLYLFGNKMKHNVVWIYVDSVRRYYTEGDDRSRFKYLDEFASQVLNILTL